LVCPEILEEGPALTANLATYDRSQLPDPEFHRPADHNERGFLEGGPDEPPDPLLRDIAPSPDWVMLESPEAARQRQENARDAANARWDRQKRAALSMHERRKKLAQAVRRG
jgi:hypothetical protein